MSYKGKGLKVANAVLATTVAASVIAVTNPANAASQKEAENLVKQAEQLAANLHTEISENNKLELPDMELYEETEEALEEAKKEVSKLKGDAKKELETRLKEKVEKYYEAATKYIKEVKDAKKQDKKSFTLSLMHTNDTHANLDNIAKRVTAVKEVRAAKTRCSSC